MTPALAVLGFLRAHWRPAAVLCALGLAFLAGRQSNPPKVTTVTQDRIVYKDRVVTQVVHEQATAKVVYRDRSTVTRKDGTVVNRDVERTESDTRSTVSTTQAETKASEKTHVAQRTVEAAKPQWHASALGGVDSRRLSDAPFVFGAHVEHRIEVFHIPGWLGAWGIFGKAQAMGGVSVGIEW